MPVETPIRVVLADDQAAMREAVRTVLEAMGCSVVATAGHAEELVRVALEHRPDLVVTDIKMPPGHGDDGLRAVREIRTARPRTAVLVLSQFADARYALDVLGDDAPAGTGYLLKERVGDLDAFERALRRVVAGGAAVDPAVVTRLQRGRRDVDLAGRAEGEQGRAAAIAALRALRGLGKPHIEA